MSVNPTDSARLRVASATIGYDKRISMEGNTTDLATEGPITIALLRKAFER